MTHPATIRTQFDEYAHFYDLLYRDKPYADEAAFISELLSPISTTERSLLELGCGTGRHAREFSRLGWTVDGVDASQEMVARARLRCTDSIPAADFSLGDVRTVKTRKKYSAVAALFHVASYQPTRADLTQMVQNAADHLNLEGKLFIDFWYGPAVLSDPPLVRVKRLVDEKIEVTRIAEPIVLPNRNQVVVNYQIFIKNRETGLFSSVQESHLLRYWFLPELEEVLGSAGFKLLRSGACYQAGVDLSVNSWFGWISAVKR